MKKRFILALAAVAILGAQIGQANASPAHHDTTGLFVFGDPSTPIPGAWSTLVTTHRGATMTIHTSGLPAHDAITIWWVIFNHPKACTAGQGGLRCGLGDLGNPAVAPSIVYAAGHVVGASGVANWGAWLAAGNTSRALFGPGLTNPMGADIHLIVHDHGPADPKLMPAEIKTVDICNPVCNDLQAAAHEQ